MYADFFTKKLGKEKVRVLADKDRIGRYQKERITFNGEVCDFQYCDAAKEDRPSELMLFAVKYGALETAMQENAHLVGDDTVLLSVLNGIRSEEDLGRRFGGEKVVHCIAQKMAAMKEMPRSARTQENWQSEFSERERKKIWRRSGIFLTERDLPIPVRRICAMRCGESFCATWA